MYFTYLAFTERMHCGPELRFDRSLFPFLTTYGPRSEMNCLWDALGRCKLELEPMEWRNMLILMWKFSHFHGADISKCTENTTVLHNCYTPCISVQTKELFFSLLSASSELNFWTKKPREPRMKIISFASSPHLTSHVLTKLISFCYSVRETLHNVFALTIKKHLSIKKRSVPSVLSLIIKNFLGHLAINLIIIIIIVNLWRNVFNTTWGIN